MKQSLEKKLIMTKSNEYINEVLHAHKDSIDIFEQRLLDNEITCIEPYFDMFLTKTFQYHLIMAKYGYYIEKLIEVNDKNILANLVKYGHAQKYYKDWAYNAEREVQIALLEKGLYIDILTQSNNADVRYAVAEKYPKRTLSYLKSLDQEKQRNLGFLLLMAQKEPDIKALKFLLNLNWHKTGQNLQILKSKYKLMHRAPSLIEKTMTPFQLYKTKNPLWKVNLSGYNIASVKQGQYKLDNENLFMDEHDFNQLATYNNEYYVDFYIAYKKSIRKD